MQRKRESRNKSQTQPSSSWHSQQLTMPDPSKEVIVESTPTTKGKEVIVESTQTTKCKEVIVESTQTTKCKEVIVESTQTTKCREVIVESTQTTKCKEVIVESTQTTKCARYMRGGGKGITAVIKTSHATHSSVHGYTTFKEVIVESTPTTKCARYMRGGGKGITAVIKTVMRPIHQCMGIRHLKRLSWRVHKPPNVRDTCEVGARESLQ